MFVHVGIHRHKPEAEEKLLDSMARFRDAMKSCDGLISVHRTKDESTGNLVGLAIWESKEHWEAARPAMLETIKDDPFDEWEDEPPSVLHLKEV